MDNQNLTQDPNLPNTTPLQAQETPVPPPSTPQPTSPNSTPPVNKPSQTKNTQTLIAVLLLLFVYPVGLLYVWIATKWPKWVKFVLTLPILLAILGIAIAVFVAIKSPDNPPTPNSIHSLTPTLVGETTNWKTFVSSDNSFSIKAPSTWTVNNTQLPIPNVECLYLDGDNSLILSACYRHSKFADSIYSKVPLRSGVKKTEINGYVAYNDKSFSLDDYYIIRPDDTFILITSGAKLDSNLFEKIVSTFKFTQ